MPEETTTVPPVDPQAGDTENLNPQAGESTSTEPQAGESQTDTTLSLEEAKKLRSEARNLRNRLKEAENLKAEIAELKKFKEDKEAESLSETEKQVAARVKLEKQLAEAQAALTRKETEVQEQKINNAIIANAAKVGINPSLAAKVLDHAEIDYDERGNPTNIEDLLETLLKDFPNLATQQQAQAQQRQASQSSAGGATNPSRATTAMPAEITKEYYDQLIKSPGAYAALTPEQRSKVMSWVSKNAR
jgi:hypothetical protein